MTSDLILSSVSQLEELKNVSKEDMLLITTTDQDGKFESKKTYFQNLKDSIGLSSAAFHEYKEFSLTSHTHPQYLKTVPLATDSTVGGFKTGYVENGINHPVKLSDDMAYVSVEDKGSEHILIALSDFLELSSKGELSSDKVYCISDDFEDTTHRFLTKEEYENLSEEEKNSDVLWCTTDECGESVTSVKVAAYYTEGDKIATISVDNVKTDIYSPKYEQQKFSTIYRWQSDTDDIGQFTWFEIWPDGWCRQGGKTVNAYGLVYTWPVSFEIYLSSVSYQCRITGEGPNSGSSAICGKQIVTTGTKTLSGFTIAACIGSGSNHFNAYYWETEGVFNSDLCTLADISAKYSSTGTWSSNLIGLNGTYSGNGGGVIDGTILNDPSETSCTITLDLTAQQIYTVENDCGLYINETSEEAFSITYSLDEDGNRPIWSHHEAENTKTEYWGNIIPLKKGQKIYARMRNTQSGTRSYTFTFYEYELNSLAPQIAMPDYDNSLIIESLPYTATQNGYAFVNIQTTVNQNQQAKLYVNNKPVSQILGAHDGLAGEYFNAGSIVPMSKGDILSATDYGQINDKYFYPCKSIPQQDCASYVIETGKFCSTDGTTHATASENDSWYRLYSDGWCEQGGIVDNGSFSRTWQKKVILNKYHSDNSYIVQLTPRDTDNQPSDHYIDGCTSSHSYTLSSFICNWYGTEDGTIDVIRYLNWKTEGFVS